MIHVFLDDVRYCPTGFAHARTADECRLLIDLEEIDILSLDYDLGWGEPSGLEVVRHIVRTGRYPRRIFFHTSSPSGKTAMREMLAANAPADVRLFDGPMPAALLEAIASGSTK